MGKMTRERRSWDQVNDLRRNFPSFIRLVIMLKVKCGGNCYNRASGLIDNRGPYIIMYIVYTREIIVMGIPSVLTSPFDLLTKINPF